MWNMKDIIMNITLFDLIDISIVAYLFYKIYYLIKETRAEQLIKGIIVLVLSLQISGIMQLQVVHWILQRTMTLGIMALLIVFQPELRRALEQIGRTKFFIKQSNGPRKQSIDHIMAEIKAASSLMSKRKTGALIVFERGTGLNEIIRTGTYLDASLSRQLLINIFEPNTPLHDGAVIIRGERIKAAGCFLPLTENEELNQEVGTRHRAALGMSEKSDSIAMVISEETGQISIAENGKLFKNLSEESLDIYLRRSLQAIDKKETFDERRA